ncbi:Cys-tRNA(Pro) deacylase [Bacillus solimangrovi]|uniref:Cys-tRNA(Pro)/Cys-tRNA(Cys) deacylase n=1 Tax=Bacillus solimangrovi TaxID=1305675 RepID=A0A1E5LH05_9BACI|nr:Cys-tRNA(Pro) deacylase [Bacillus solimangrovi]OEH93359.1 aminoacyl-tRNA deacylase [Bacillus solimangrovi]
MGKKIKTNAMRILDAEQLTYEMISYNKDDGKIDGVSVAYKIGRPTEVVFKTLVAQGTSKNTYVFVIPVEAELDLKRAAKATNEKKIEMIAVKDIQKLTGYIRGGCSPIGMKKLYDTFVDNSAKHIKQIVVSGGKVGVQIELKVEDLLKLTNGKLAELTK